MNTLSIGSSGKTHTDAVLPDTSVLARDLNAVLRCRGNNGSDRLRIVQRTLNPHSSTFTSEIVTCAENGQCLNLLCKFDRPIRTLAREHRLGIAYEAAVYQNALAESGDTVPRFYGYRPGDSKSMGWLALEHVTTGVKVQRTPHSHAIVEAARWLGRFHAEQERKIAQSRAIGLRVMDDEFYRHGIESLGETESRLVPGWLEHLCTMLSSRIGELIDSPMTLVHGEFYPNNILFDLSRNRILPVDWETAALGAGEYDLAMLTENWPGPVRTHCELAYSWERWGRNAPVAVARRLQLARMHLAIRWFYNSIDANHEMRQRCVAQIARLAREAGWMNVPEES